MAEQFSPERARGIIEDGVERAKSYVDNPEQIQDLLVQLQDKLKELPDTVASAFTNVPLMAAMVKSYITREYTEVSPKVVISLVSAFLYLVKQKDLIPDDIPVVGFVDDIAVATIAMAINEPELNAYKQWRELNGVQNGADMLEPPIDVPAEVTDVRAVEDGARE